MNYGKLCFYAEGTVNERIKGIKKKKTIFEQSYRYIHS